MAVPPSRKVVAFANIRQDGVVVCPRIRRAVPCIRKTNIVLGTPSAPKTRRPRPVRVKLYEGKTDVALRGHTAVDLAAVGKNHLGVRRTRRVLREGLIHAEGHASGAVTAETVVMVPPRPRRDHAEPVEERRRRLGETVAVGGRPWDGEILVPTETALKCRRDGRRRDVNVAHVLPTRRVAVHDIRQPQA